VIAYQVGKLINPVHLFHPKLNIKGKVVDGSREARHKIKYLPSKTYIDYQGMYKNDFSLQALACPLTIGVRPSNVLLCRVPDLCFSILMGYTDCRDEFFSEYWSSAAFCLLVRDRDFKGVFMGERTMTIGEMDRKGLKEVLRELLPEVLGEYRERREIDLVERVVRVEEGLHNLHELMQRQLKFMEQQFEQVNRRFEQVDKRFEEVDKRFAMLQWFMGLGFSGIAVLMALFNYL